MVAACARPIWPTRDDARCQIIPQYKQLEIHNCPLSASATPSPPNSPRWVLVLFESEGSLEETVIAVLTFLLSRFDSLELAFKRMDVNRVSGGP